MAIGIMSMLVAIHLQLLAIYLRMKELKETQRAEITALKEEIEAYRADRNELVKQNAHFIETIKKERYRCQTRHGIQKPYMGGPND